MDISVIIPVYNAEKYLNRCIESLLKQTCNNYEIILINDGSTDRSGLICNDYAKRYFNIRVIHKKNGGSGSARNRGLSIAKGKYIAFVDSDDFVRKDYLEKIFELAGKYNADIVECDFNIVRNYEESTDDSSDKTANIEELKNIEMLEAFCDRKTYLKTVVLWNKLFKKQLFDGIQFKEGKGIDDEYLICHLLYRSRICIITDEVLYFYYMSAGSQMRSGYSLKNLDSIEVIEKQLIFFKKINCHRLYNMLLYRYYSCIIFNCYFMKKKYPQEKELIKQISNKRKKFYKVFFLKEVSCRDKIVLFIKRIAPWSSHIINKER